MVVISIVTTMSFMQRDDHSLGGQLGSLNRTLNLISYAPFRNAVGFRVKGFS